MITDKFSDFSGSGDHDMCVPYTGSEAWTRSMGYEVIDEWRPWTSNGQVAGYFILLLIYLQCLLHRKPYFFTLHKHFIFN